VVGHEPAYADLAKRSVDKVAGCAGITEGRKPPSLQDAFSVVEKIIEHCRDDADSELSIWPYLSIACHDAFASKLAPTLMFVKTKILGRH